MMCGMKTLMRALLWEVPKVLLAPFLFAAALVGAAFKFTFGWIFEMFKHPDS